MKDTTLYRLAEYIMGIFFGRNDKDDIEVECAEIEKDELLYTIKLRVNRWQL